jgi:ech hydrogenase subunit B
MELLSEVILISIMSVALFVLAPFLGMLAMGLGRKMSARMQNRVGPPLLQPWYDVQKLLMKEDTASNSMLGAMAFAFFIFNALGVVVLVTLGDLLITLILFGLAQLFISLAGFSGSAPYSHVGASRNLLQVLCVEPLLVMMAIGVMIVNGNYFIKDMALNGSILLYLPAALLVMVFALLVWMQKGPFDLSTAHQEVAYGPLVELSGKNLALVEMGHWFETFGLLGIFSLFFNTIPLLSPVTGMVPAVLMDIVLKGLVGFFGLLVVIWIDNSTTRSAWARLPKFSFYIMLPILFINIVVITAKFQWGWF